MTSCNKLSSTRIARNLRVETLEDRDLKACDFIPEGFATFADVALTDAAQCAAAGLNFALAGPETPPLPMNQQILGSHGLPNGDSVHSQPGDQRDSGQEQRDLFFEYWGRAATP